MVEIKELVVRAIIANQAPSASNSSTEATEGADMETAPSLGQSSDIVEDCVRQVLAILERQKER